MMTAECVKRAKKAMRAARAELELWMREHGHDIDSMEAFNELGNAISIVDALAKERTRAIELLAHAVESVDVWSADWGGGKIEGDELIDEARALVSAHKAATP
jgi:hypothetical protein